MEIKSTLNYTFDFNHLANLDIPSNVWLPYGQHGQVYRTNKGTGSIHTSDNGGTYDAEGIYHSVWYQIDWADGAWSSSLEATDWETAKQKVEGLLNAS